MHRSKVERYSITSTARSQLSGPSFASAASDNSHVRPPVVLDDHPD
jgi:hypothetical protein